MNDLFIIETNKKFDLIRGLNITPLNERHKLSLKDLKKGSYIQLNDETLVVNDIYTYKDKEGEWKEYRLVNILTLEKSFIEIEEDDDLIITLSDKQVKMEDLPDTDDIEEMSENEEGEIVLNRKTYYYDDDYKAKFTRDGKDKKEKVYFYEFVSSNKETLTIEEWGSDKTGYTYEAWISREIPENSIEILSI